MGRVEELIGPAAVKKIREEIAQANGNEVFFVGSTDAARRVEGVQVLARGDSSAVPAFLHTVSYGDVVIHNHPTGALTPSRNDLALAASFGNLGVGFYIIDNDVSSVYVVVEAFAKKEKAWLAPGRVTSLLKPGGAIAGQLERYEHRPQQVEMARALVNALNGEKVAVIEAGTGTGKTLAYLIPGVLWAVENKERVVVSTYTINLQEQLVGKDIPLLRKALDVPFKVVLMKGRGNYICLRKVRALERDFPLLVEPEEAAEAKALMEWAWKSQDGSLADLNFLPRSEVWEKVMSESDACPRTTCAFYYACPYHKARREAASADLLVVNHHLLFADLALRAELGSYTELAILPTYKRIIVDEAHNAEDVATEYFGIMVSRHGLVRLLERLHRVRDSERGLIPYLKAAIQKRRRASGLFMREMDEEIVPIKERARALCDEAFDAIAQFVAELVVEEVDEKKLRITPKVEELHGWGVLAEKCRELVSVLLSLEASLASLEKELRGLEEQSEELSTSLVELSAVRGRLGGFAQGIAAVMQEGVEEEVRWVEVRPGRRGSVVHLQRAPIEIAQRMSEVVYNRFPTIVLTSATLTVRGGFSYLNRRLGLGSVEAERLLEMSLPSPFDYRRQVICGIPLDIPLPGEAGYEEKLFSFILRALTITGGRAFVLFTSFRMLRGAFAALAEPLGDIGIHAWKQGDEGRDRLLRRFREDTTSVLFATESFWQGVDVEGEALECVILVKLPFRVPTEPIHQARVDEIRRSGGNPFYDYVVPQAVIKFKQGFGRLIRRKTDRGVLLVLDRRVIGRPYGRLFLDSLPECETIVGDAEHVLERLRAFFAKGRE